MIKSRNSAWCYDYHMLFMTIKMKHFWNLRNLQLNKMGSLTAFWRNNICSYFELEVVVINFKCYYSVAIIDFSNSIEITLFKINFFHYFFRRRRMASNWLALPQTSGLYLIMDWKRQINGFYQNVYKFDIIWLVDVRILNICKP